MRSRGNRWKKPTMLGTPAVSFLRGQAAPSYINVLLSFSKAFQSFPASLNFKHDLQRCFLLLHVRNKKLLPMDFASSARWKEWVFTVWGWSYPNVDLKSRSDLADSKFALKIRLERWKSIQPFRCVFHEGKQYAALHTDYSQLSAEPSSQKELILHQAIWEFGGEIAKEKMGCWRNMSLETLDQWWSLARSSQDPMLHSPTRAGCPRRRQQAELEPVPWDACKNASLEPTLAAGGQAPSTAVAWLFSRNPFANSEPANSLLTRE